MSTLQLLTQDLSHQPDSLLQEVWHYLKFLKQQRQANAEGLLSVPAAQPDPGPTPVWPDFEERLRTIYQGRIGQDSLEAIHSLREDRF